VISESAIVCQVKPDDPKIVVFGERTVESLIWETCVGNDNERLISFAFLRQRPGSVTQEQIASRGATEGGFAMIRPFQDKKKYDARADQELRLLNVQEDDEYVYTLEINYQASAANGGAFLKEAFQVTVDVKG